MSEFGDRSATSFPGPLRIPAYATCSRIVSGTIQNPRNSEKFYDSPNLFYYYFNK